MIDIEEPKIPYRKKKNGDVSKANKKSKHKHIYDKIVLLTYSAPNGYVYDGEKLVHFRCHRYCSICGKIGDKLPKWGEPDYFNWLNYNTVEDWLEKYPTAEYIDMGETYAYYKLDNINEVINNGI